VQYEVSAYARAGARCRHNVNYWSFGDYVGIGAGAHGKLSLELPQRILRTAKPKQPRDYLAQTQALAAAGTPSIGAARDVAGNAACAASRIGESSFIRPADLPFEFMLNALRLNEGFSMADYQERTGLGADSVEVKIAAGLGRGLLESRTGGWRPTELGRRFLNDLQASFLA
jgi:oxygen-independent coproporphyrinogen-3 oxidase